MFCKLFVLIIHVTLNYSMANLMFHEQLNFPCLSWPALEYALRVRLCQAEHEPCMLLLIFSVLHQMLY